MRPEETGQPGPSLSDPRPSEPEPLNAGRADQGWTGSDASERFRAGPRPPAPAPGVLDAAMERVG
jgi:hypothetical protein